MEADTTRPSFSQQSRHPATPYRHSAPAQQVRSLNFLSLCQLFLMIPSPVSPDDDGMHFRSSRRLVVSISSPIRRVLRFWLPLMLSNISTRVFRHCRVVFNALYARVLGRPIRVVPPALCAKFLREQVSLAVWAPLRFC